MKKQEKSRLDKIVEHAGEEVASRTSRRGFLGRMAGLSGAALFGGAVILGEKNPAGASQCATGCYNQGEVNVCYSPWKVNVAWPGYSGVPMFKGPSVNSPVLGDSSWVIPVGEYFGRCSNRNAASCADPGPRSAQDIGAGSFIWGYRAYGTQRIGWIPYQYNGTTYTSGDTNYSGAMCGPAGADFDCRKAKSACPSYNGCSGGNYERPTTSSNCYKPVLDGGSQINNSSTGYLVRYAPNSCGIYWLHAGDKVHQYCYTTSAVGAFHWACFSAVSCAWMPAGCRGWVGWEKLDSNVISQPSCSGPSLACVSASGTCG